VATTLAELEQRLQALEEEVASLRELVLGSSPSPTPAEHQAPRNKAKGSPTELEATLQTAYQKMGISGEAPGIENLRALLVAQGVPPGDEIVRQEIAAMRQQEEEPGE